MTHNSQENGRLLNQDTSATTRLNGNLLQTDEMKEISISININDDSQEEKEKKRIKEVLINLRLYKFNSAKMTHRNSIKSLIYGKSETYRKEKFFNELFGYSGDNYKVNLESFQHLFDIFDDKSTEYYETALEAIYLHFSELKDFKFSNDELKSLIEKALKIEKKEYGIEVLKILLVFSKYLENSAYHYVKKKILAEIKRISNVYSPNAFYSMCKASYKDMMRDCNFEFFNLLFLLRENLVLQFKTEYQDFIKRHKQFFGEYWIYAIQRNGQLLYIMADLQNLVDTREFLLINTKDSGLKLNIMTSFRRNWEFQSLINKKQLILDEKILLNELTSYIESRFIKYSEDGIYINEEVFQKTFKNTPDIRKMFFGRKNLKSKSLFEEVLSKPELANGSWDKSFAKILSYIWSEFRLWEIPEIWTMKNPNQQRLIDHALNTKNDPFIISILMLKIPYNYKDIQKPLHYMMLKNSLMHDYQSENQQETSLKCLIDYHLSLIDKNKRKDYKNTKNLLYFFEEMHQYYQNQKENAQYFKEVFEQILTDKSEKFDGENELKLPRKHFWIGIMMIHLGYYVKFEMIEQTGHRKSFVNLKHQTNHEDVLSFEAEFIPYLHLLSLITNKDETEFEKQFRKEMIKMEKSYSNIYRLSNTYDNHHQNDNESEKFNFYEKYSTNFSFILLYAAIQTNQKKIVKIIFRYNNFLICCPEFPQNMIVSDIHHYTAQMFLKNKYELGRGELPKNWINRETLEDFLDSRITCQDNFYKLDCQFMLPYYNHDEKPEIVDDGVIANEDYDTMDYILNDHDLRSVVTHPVMETIIRTKIRKYARIFFWNLVGFILFYVIPTFLIFYCIHSQHNITGSTQPNNSTLNETSLNYSSYETLSDRTDYMELNDDYDAETNKSTPKDHPFMSDIKTVPKRFDQFNLIIVLIIVRLMFLIPREYIQMTKIHRRNYLSRKSNWLEIGLIIISIIYLVLIVVFQDMTNELIDMKDTDENQANIKILYYSIFLVEAVNVVLTIIATVILYPTVKFSVYMKCLQTIFYTYITAFFIFSPIFFGFLSIVYILFDEKVGGKIFKSGNNENEKIEQTIAKYVFMYAGEIGIDSDDVSGMIQVAVLAIMIILIINKANLILSIVINDVQKIMDKSKEYTLRLHAKKYVEFAKKIRIFYSREIDNQQNICCMTSILFYFTKFFTSKYPHLHQVNILYVDKTDRSVRIDNTIILNWVLSDDTLKKLKKIVEKRSKIDCRREEVFGGNQDDE